MAQPPLAAGAFVVSQVRPVVSHVVPSTHASDELHSVKQVEPEHLNGAQSSSPRDVCTV
jgi:hypothetical protein